MEEYHQVYFKNIREKIIENIKTAEFEILIAVAWLTDEKIISELANSASRNVDISIIFYDDHINKKDLFKNLYYFKANIRFTRKLMHNKFCIIDKNIVLNGSYNWTYNASSNHENITVSSNNLILVNQFTDEFNKIFRTGEQINSHFRNIVNEIQHYDNDYCSDYKGSTIFPYFYLIDDVTKNLPIGYYFIKNKDEEEMLHKILYFKKLNYLIKDVNRITNSELIIPKRFDGVINIKYIENKIILPKYFFESTIGVEVIISSKKYIQNIDNNGNQIGNTKYHFEEKLSNGFYYNFYNPLNRSSRVKLYDNKLNITELDIYSAEKIDNIGIFGKKNNKFGLYNLEGKLLVEHIYDAYKFIKEKNLVEFQEFPILVCETSYPPNDYIKSYSRYSNNIIKGSETYKASYYNLKNKKIEENKDVKVINSKGWHTYYFKSDRNGVYQTLYSLVDNALYRISLKEMQNLCESTALNHNHAMTVRFFEYQQQRQAHEEKMEKERKEREAKNCYIATMVYKDIQHPKVEFLRLFRDEKLKKYYLGQKFICFYYKYSEEVVIYLKDKKIFNSIIKSVLNLLITLIKKLDK